MTFSTIPLAGMTLFYNCLKNIDNGFGVKELVKVLLLKEMIVV